VEHGLTAPEYIEKHGPVKCSSSFDAYSKQNKKNGDWIQRANDAGTDLSEYKQKMGKAVSASIMSNDKERQRRSDLLGTLNKTEKFRKKSSETAKITSARPEILKRRTEQLRKWREENWEEFYEKCVVKYINGWTSRPETALFEIVSSIEGYSFKRSQRVKSVTFPTKSKFRQVDIGDIKLRVYLEFDGDLHFQKKFESQDLDEIQLKDKLLDEHIEKHNWTLIRISYDQWNKKEFKKECLEQLFESLKNPQPGVTRIGKMYNG